MSNEQTQTTDQIPAHWTAERRLRSAIMMLDGACDAALRLAQMDDALRSVIVDARAYAKECQR